MAVTAQMVKELREMTGAGMMDCKKALVETDGNIEAAVDLLREKGLAKAAKKAGRVAAEGLVKIAFTEDHKTAAIVEVVTGQPWDIFLKERVLDKLGMKDSTFNPTDEQLSRAISLYNVKEGEKAQFRLFHPYFPRPYNGNTFCLSTCTIASITSTISSASEGTEAVMQRQTSKVCFSFSTYEALRTRHLLFRKTNKMNITTKPTSTKANKAFSIAVSCSKAKYRLSNSLS